MFQIPINIQVAVSKRIVSKKDNRAYNAIEGMAAGIGVFKLFVPEEKVPDKIEGKTVRAQFTIGVDKNLNLSLRFVGIDGLIE